MKPHARPWILSAALLSACAPAPQGTWGLGAVDAPRYGLAATGAFTTVTGVVTDPRGAALAAARVKVSCPAANGGAGATVNVETDAQGFFSAGLPNVAAGSTVSVSATATTPGGVALGVATPVTATVAGPQAVVHCRLDDFAAPGAPTLAGASVVGAGQEAAIRVAGASTRLDEFHLRLSSGDQLLDVAPTQVAGDTIRFPVPANLPDAAFTVSLVPFGMPDRATAPSPRLFSVNYTQADFNRDVTAAPATLTDATAPAGVLNGALFIGGDQAVYTVTLTNASTLLAHDVELAGTVSAGTTIASATVGGAPVTVASQPHATTGAFSLAGLRLPQGAPVPVSLTFVSPLRLANNAAFGLTGLSLRLPGLELTRSIAASPTLTARSLDTAALTVTKALLQEGAANDGAGRVRLTIAPGASGALGAIKLTDVTKTEASGPATAASFTGTATLPAAGTPLGLAAGDHLDLKIDGGAVQVVQIYSPSYDAETLIGQINTAAGLSGNVTASRVANRFVLERVAQGPTRTLEIAASSSPAVLTRLGLITASKGSGYVADLATATATQPGGTVWTVVSSANTWATTGSTTVSVTLRPPAAYAPGDGPTAPITFSYPINKLNGTAGTLGGTGTGLGPRLTAFNLVAPYTDAARDQALTVTGAEPAALGSL